MLANSSVILAIILLLILGGTFLSGLGSEQARANSFPTPTLIAKAWNFLPIVRGEVVGPTVTPQPPPPTRTPYHTITPSPTATATPKSTKMPANTPSPTNTLQPSATATERPSGGHVKILSILYSPDGSDVDNEYVRLENIGGDFNMKGWQLHDEASTTFTFPDFMLAADAEVRIWTGSGSNNGQNLFWNSNRSIWNNGGDAATLKNKSGGVVDTCSYAGGGTITFCGD